MSIVTTLIAAAVIIAGIIGLYTLPPGSSWTALAATLALGGVIFLILEAGLTR